MRQYFYLVVINYDESTYPQKVFLQEYEAVKWGKREATKAKLKGEACTEYVLFKQEMSRTGRLTRVKTLTPYEESVIPKLKEPLVVDYDMDKERY